MGNQPDFQLPFVKTSIQGQEVEQVGVFQGLLHEIRIGRRQTQGKVAGRLTQPGMSGGFDLCQQHRAAPAIFHGGPHVPAARL